MTRSDKKKKKKKSRERARVTLIMHIRRILSKRDSAEHSERFMYPLGAEEITLMKTNPIKEH